MAQITDSHLFGDPAGRLLGIETRKTFEAVLDLALNGHPTGDAADAVVMTGDLVHDETPEAYRWLRNTLEGLALPCFCIPGNHDRPDLMARHLEPFAMDRVDARRLGPWQLAFLDSTVPGRDGGRVAPDDLDRLETLLVRDAAPTLIFLHHHPARVGSAWMDTMGAENGAELLAISERCAQVKAVIFGHVHQDVRPAHPAIPVLGAPSTCVQFLPGSPGFAVDSRPPGYRELLLAPDGTFTTRVLRLDAYPDPPSLDTEGY